MTFRTDDLPYRCSSVLLYIRTSEQKHISTHLRKCNRTVLNGLSRPGSPRSRPIHSHNVVSELLYSPRGVSRSPSELHIASLRVYLCNLAHLYFCSYVLRHNRTSVHYFKSTFAYECICTDSTIASLKISSTPHPLFLLCSQPSVQKFNCTLGRLFIH